MSISDLGKFLRQLPFMITFQISVISTFTGLLVGDWFCTKVLKLPESDRYLVWLTVIGMNLIVLISSCYREYAGKLELPQDTPTLNKLMIRNILILSPLLVATVLVVEPLISSQYLKAWAILSAGIMLWAVLRLFFRARKIEASETPKENG
jgi:hypothetical protein